MNPRAFLIAGLSVLVGLAFGLSMIGSTEAQQPAANTPQIGRYEMAVHNGAVVVLDSTTGECWYNDGTQWTVLGDPKKPPAGQQE